MMMMMKLAVVLMMQTTDKAGRQAIGGPLGGHPNKIARSGLDGRHFAALKRRRTTRPIRRLPLARPIQQGAQMSSRRRANQRTEWPQFVWRVPSDSVLLSWPGRNRSEASQFEAELTTGTNLTNSKSSRLLAGRPAVGELVSRPIEGLRAANWSVVF